MFAGADFFHMVSESSSDTVRNDKTNDAKHMLMFKIQTGKFWKLALTSIMSLLRGLSF